MSVTIDQQIWKTLGLFLRRQVSFHRVVAVIIVYFNLNKILTTQAETGFSFFFFVSRKRSLKHVFNSIKSLHVRISGFLNPGKFCSWNPESWNFRFWNRFRCTDETSPEIFLMKARLLHVFVLSTGPISVANTFTDQMEKPRKTFVTTKVLLRHPNRQIVFRATPNQPNRLLKHRENHLRHFWRLWNYQVVGCPSCHVV